MHSSQMVHFRTTLELVNKPLMSVCVLGNSMLYSPGRGKRPIRPFSFVNLVGDSWNSMQKILGGNWRPARTKLTVLAVENELKGCNVIKIWGNRNDTWIWSRKKEIDLKLEEKKVWKCFLIKGALIPQFLQYSVADVAWGNRKITQKVNLCSFILSQHTLSRSGLVSWQKRLYIVVASKYVVQWPSHVRLLWPHGLQHTWPPCPHHLPKFAQVHVHCLGDAIQPSHPLTPSPSVLNLSSVSL